MRDRYGLAGHSALVRAGYLTGDFCNPQSNTGRIHHICEADITVLHLSSFPLHQQQLDFLINGAFA